MWKETTMAQSTLPPTSERFGDLTQYWCETHRDVARFSLDSFEQAADAVLGYERRAVESVQPDWLREALVVRITLLDEAKSAYLRAARALLA